MLATHAVGIDLGTTYSCIAYLNEHGEPISIPNHDGELSTPSVVLFDGKNVVVGTEALRNSIRYPDKVVVHAKRYMGNLSHRWKINGKSYSPIDISTLILKSMLDNAREKIGPIDRAVITVPAQFSEVQRQATAEAGKRAGLTHVDIINEPVAAALCFVLGTEGIWFSELATSQTVMVVDLGGGTFDLSLVRYKKNEVTVIASGGDLHLGGIDWNSTLETAIAKQFQREFGIDPLQNRENAQALALEAEQAKRSLSVRPRAALTVSAEGQRKTYQVELEQFERLSADLMGRMEKLTVGLLDENKMGWAKVDVVLTTGGASRMPMVRTMLKRLSGRTLNTSLSPDQSIAHGATYYAGMLLTNSDFAKSILVPAAVDRLSQIKQRSVNARALGVLVRDPKTNSRFPHYIMKASTPLPAAVSQIYGTVTANQERVRLRIVESGTAADSNFVEIGLCQIEPLPPNLPVDTEIEVTISYDEQARIHVFAKVLSTGQEARTEIIREENLLIQALSEGTEDDDVNLKSEGTAAVEKVASPAPRAAAAVKSRPVSSNLSARPKEPRQKGPLESGSSVPVTLCEHCGTPVAGQGRCQKCGKAVAGGDAAKMKKIKAPSAVAKKSKPPLKPGSQESRPDMDDSEFWRFLDQQ